MAANKAASVIVGGAIPTLDIHRGEQQEASDEEATEPSADRVARSAAAYDMGRRSGIMARRLLARQSYNHGWSGSYKFHHTNAVINTVTVHLIDMSKASAGRSLAPAC